MPADFGGLPGLAAGGPQGVVAVGQLASNSGRMPVFWHLGDGFVWEREAIPVMPAPTAPNPRTCGPKPDDLLGLLSTDSLGGDLLGDAPITVRGWSVPCDGCYSRSPGHGRRSGSRNRQIGVSSTWRPTSRPTGAPWMASCIRPRGTSPRLRGGWRSPDTSTIRQRRHADGPRRSRMSTGTAAPATSWTAAVRASW